MAELGQWTPPGQSADTSGPQLGAWKPPAAQPSTNRPHVGHQLGSWAPPTTAQKPVMRAPVPTENTAPATVPNKDQQLGNNISWFVDEMNPLLPNERKAVGNAVGGAMNAIGNNPVGHMAGTALGKIGNALTTSLSLGGAMVNDVAHDTGLRYRWTHPFEMNLNLNPQARSPKIGPRSQEVVNEVLHGNFDEMNQRHFPTSDASLRDLESAGIPGVTQVAHFIREHPILANLPITAVMTLAAPGAEARLPSLLVDAAKFAGKGAARGAAAAGSRFAASRLGQTPVGQHVVNAGSAVAHTLGHIPHALNRSIGDPTATLRRAVVPDAPQQAAARRQTMAVRNADRRGAYEGRSRTQSTFRPGGAQPLDAEKTQAIDLYQTQGHANQFAQAPPEVQAAAKNLTQAWDQVKQTPEMVQRLHATMYGRIPPTGTRSLDVHFAPDEWVDRELNAAGVPANLHDAVKQAARNYHVLSRYMPQVAPASAQRVGAVAKNLKHERDTVDQELLATHPDLLKNQKTAYFPMRDILEDQSTGPTTKAMGGPKGGIISKRHEQKSNYATVAQLRDAGYEPFEGLSPEEAFSRDLSDKYKSIYATKAFHTIGQIPEVTGGTLLEGEHFVDPHTGQRITFEEAQKLAKIDRDIQAASSAAANLGVKLHSNRLVPEHFPNQIASPEAAKARALQLLDEEKKATKLVGNVNKSGTKLEDIAQRGAAKQEGAAGQLGAAINPDLEAMQGSGYERTANERQALGKAKEAIPGAVEAAGNKVSGLPLEKNEARKVLQTHKDLSNAYDRAMSGATREIGSGAAAQQKALAKGSRRVQTSVDKYQKLQKRLSAYTVGATARQKAQLTGLAQKYASGLNQRLNDAVTKYYVSAYDSRRMDEWRKAMKAAKAEMNTADGADAIMQRVMKDVSDGGYRQTSKLYVNASELQKLGINIPGVGPDRRIATDAYKFFEENQVPRQYITPLAEMMGTINNFARSSFVSNWTIHGIFNLGANYIARTKDIAGLANAMPMLLGQTLPEGVQKAIGADKAWEDWEQQHARTFQILQAENGWTPGAYRDELPYFKPKEEVRGPNGEIVDYKKPAGQTSAVKRANTSYSELGLKDKIQKAVEAFSDWNSKIVFDRFEKWYAVNTFEREAQRLGSTAMAADSVRDTLGTDLITQAEKQAISKGFWFYPWWKTITKFAVATGIHNPETWNSAVQAAQSEREGEGAGDLRVSNPLTIVRRNGQGYDTYTVTNPYVSSLNAMATAFTGPSNPNTASIERFKPLMNQVTGHFNPYSRLAYEAGNEITQGRYTPGYEQLVDPNASLPQMGAQLAGNALGKAVYPLQEGESFANKTGQQGLGAAIGEGLMSMAGVRHGFQLKGDTTQGHTPGSPEDNFSRQLTQIRNRLEMYRTGGKISNPEAYSQEQKALELLYKQFPMMPRE